MTTDHRIVPIASELAPVNIKNSHYPEPFASLMTDRQKRKLGDMFGLSKFGVNLTVLAPGGSSALCHRHSKQDEFIYVLEGNPSLVIGDAEYEMAPGQCCGFPAGVGDAHRLINRTDAPVHFLEVGDRTAGDDVTYPNDDIAAVLDQNGRWEFRRKDGTLY